MNKPFIDSGPPLRMFAADLIRFRAARAEDCVQILRGNRTAALILRERTESGEVTGRWLVWIKHKNRWEHRTVEVIPPLGDGRRSQVVFFFKHFFNTL